jgi:hypothetical protein
MKRSVAAMGKWAFGNLVKATIAGSLWRAAGVMLQMKMG